MPHRILDANRNRASEGCRVVEDFVRFVLGDAQLSQAYKDLRHDLTRSLQPMQPEHWVRCRDAAGDVGAELTTESESLRTGPEAVALASQSRLEQALRCLEEFTKLESPTVSQHIERLRYAAYGLAKRWQTQWFSRQRLQSARLYVLIDDRGDPQSFARDCDQWFQHGVDVLQLRAKGLADDALWERATLLVQAARRHEKLAIINDRPDIAAACEADGVHLGQDDLPVLVARKLVGPRALIGRSTHDLSQVSQAVADGADYLGFGPTFPSRTKQFADDAIRGLEFLRQAAQATGLPGFAIGGVDADNIDEVLACGVHGVAVSSAVSHADDPLAAIGALVGKLAPQREQRP